MSQDKFEVNVDKETHTLYVNVEVRNRPVWQGISFYDTSRVVAELNKQGYNVTERDCTNRSRPVRSDDGKGEEYSKTKWEFKLASNSKENKKTTKTVPKAVPKAVPKTTKKTSTKTKKTTRKSADSVVE